MTQRRALICGISGQDGAYLARFLLEKDYLVFGTSRDAVGASLTGLRHLGIEARVQLLSMAPNDFRSVLTALVDSRPDEIYNLAGQSSVGLSFSQPVETIESISIGTLNLLEAIRFQARAIRLYNAGSSECYGDTGGIAATEETPFRPRSPYAVAKACAHNLIANYRDAYSIYCCTGILFNHESPLRPDRFVTKKIIKSAVAISRGTMDRVALGNLDISRDWGWAPDYVEAMWCMLQAGGPSDFIIATGRTESLSYFVAKTFSALGLDWQAHVDVNEQLKRPSDIGYGGADPSRAREILGWSAVRDIDDVIQLMLSAELAAAAGRGS